MGAAGVTGDVAPGLTSLDWTLGSLGWRTGSIGSVLVATGPNLVQNIGSFSATGNFTLADKATLTVAGPLAAGTGVAGETLKLSGAAIAVTAGASLTASGTLDLLAPSIRVGDDAILVAPRIVLATQTAGGSISVGNGATLDARSGNTLDASGKPLYVVGKDGISAPIDQSDATTGGVYLTIGSLDASGDTPPSDHNGFNAATGTGTITLGDITVGGPLLRLALPDNLNSGRDSGTIQAGTLSPLGTASKTVVLTWLGNGKASATLEGQQLGVLTTSQAASATFYGAVSNAAGETFTAGSGAAASAASQGQYLGRLAQDGTAPAFELPAASYLPNGKLQFGGCAISSVNCRLVIVVEVPPQVALPPFAAITAAPEDDFDLLLPDISDEVY